MSIILGIDPGSHITGFGVVKNQGDQIVHVSHGIILLPKEQALPERLRVLSEEMREVLAKFEPDHVVIEKIFMGKSADSAFKLGHARGVVMSLAATSGAEVHEYASRLVKKAIAGKGSAEKTQVKRHVEVLLQLPEIDKLDASDALALAIFHAQYSHSKKLLQRMREVSV